MKAADAERVLVVGSQAVHAHPQSHSANALVSK